jgi:hypothetical protein
MIVVAIKAGLDGRIILKSAGQTISRPDHHSNKQPTLIGVREPRRVALYGTSQANGSQQRTASGRGRGSRTMPTTHRAGRDGPIHCSLIGAIVAANLEHRDRSASGRAAEWRSLWWSASCLLTRRSNRLGGHDRAPIEIETVHRRRARSVA